MRIGIDVSECMGKVATTVKKPLLFQSKLLCFSLLYLLATLFLALSPSKCLFRSSPFDPLQSPLFSYPPSYRPHNYALPTHRPACSSPVFFSDYAQVLEEIGGLCKNSSYFPGAAGLRYRQQVRNADSFGGNLTIRERIAYFDREGGGSAEVPCGFLKDFPIRETDKMVMERCNEVVVVSAIFNNHDKIRQPRGLGSQTLAAACFFMFVDDATLNDLFRQGLIQSQSRELRIGAWRIVRVSSEQLYENPTMNGVIPKYLVHRLFPNSKFSIWIDAKLQLFVDPLLLIHTLLVSQDADMAISRHPYYVHTMEEAMATARWKKWRDIDSLREQMETYCENGLMPWSHKKLPYPSDVPDSALIIRKHGLASNLFSCLVFNELEAFNPRDQLAFAFVRDSMKPRMRLNMFDVEVFEQVAAEYRHNLKRGSTEKGSASGTGEKRSKREASPNFCLSVNASCWGRCEKYLSIMWG